MRSTALFAVVVAIIGGGFALAQPKSKEKQTAAAELTRTKSLKAKMEVDFRDARLGDVLKEFAAQVDMRAETVILWSYGPNFPYSQKISYACKNKTLEAALDELLTKVGGELGYIVVSKDGDKYDGWIQLTTTGERGTAQPPATAEDEKVATERLTLAKKLIDAGKPESAKPLLEILTKKYATTKAGAEAKELLEKIEK